MKRILASLMKFVNYGEGDDPGAPGGRQSRGAFRA